MRTAGRQAIATAIAAAKTTAIAAAGTTAITARLQSDYIGDRKAITTAIVKRLQRRS
jgi:hypothetical protein